MGAVPKRHDPLSALYYRGSAAAERVVDSMFYVTGCLSIIALTVSREIDRLAYDIVHGLFVISVIFICGGGLAVRLYWSSRAHAARISDFFSNAFRVKLSPDVSVEYYNSAERLPFGRMAAALAENTLYTKEIAREMLWRLRASISVYFVVWMFAVFNRSTDLALVSAIAQVLFGEQIVSRWVRLEWLRIRSEVIHRDICGRLLVTNDFESPVLQASILEQIVLYETAKAQAGISLSSRVFRKIHDKLAERWNKLALDLSL